MDNIKKLLKSLRTNGSNGLNGKSVSSLLLYWNTKYEYYNTITVSFFQLNYRHPESVSMNISFNASRLKIEYTELENYGVFFEDYLLRIFNPAITGLNKSYENENKAEHLVGKVNCEKINCNVCHRSGLTFNVKSHQFTLKLLVTFPTGGGTTVLGNKMVRMISDLLKLINEKLDNVDVANMCVNLECYKNQQRIRYYCELNGYISFVANGSILPRQGDTDMPLESAIPFTSPKELEIEIELENGLKLSGMGMKKGIIVITGAGFSGKTTLLEAIELGIYNHILGDGREYVITDNTAMMVNAEDGRFVGDIDLSPFFLPIPNKNICNFSTKNASGSVSQAVNIIEALNAECKLLLIDEDKSATNFLARDEKMRLIIKDEIIIPLTDRMNEIKNDMNVSIIMVIGATSEYLKYADTVLLMEHYSTMVITSVAKEIVGIPSSLSAPSILWNKKRYYICPKINDAKFAFYSVTTEKMKKIVFGTYSSDITQLTSISEDDQLHTLAYALNYIVNKNDEKHSLVELINEFLNDFHCVLLEDSFECDSRYCSWWFSDVRSIDILSCINRMRGFRFENK